MVGRSRLKIFNCLSGTRTYIDIIADELFVAEKEGRKIAVEVKSFVSKSDLSELEKAIRKVIIYRFAVRKEEPERQLYLTVGEQIYNKLFVHSDLIELIESEDLKVLVCNESKEVLVRWIN